MIIALCCIIFITYISIFGLLTYYFIKQRKIWDKLFTLDAISQTIDDFITNCFIEMFACPEHFIICIPNMIMENTPCIAKRKETITLRAKVKVLLDTLKHNISILQDEKKDLYIKGARGAEALAKIKWILEGTTKEFYTVYNEPSNVYYKLIESYDILGKGNKKEKEEEKEKDKYEIKDNKLSLDDLYVLETEVEICKNILKYIYHSEIMKTLEHNCYNKDNYKAKDEDNNSYILALMYDIIDCIRLKKINASRIIYQINNE
jgi:hypothetical protein